MLQLLLKKTLYHQVFAKGCKKLVFVLASSTLVTKTGKEAVEAIETAEADKNGKENKDEYLENLI